MNGTFMTLCSRTLKLIFSLRRSVSTRNPAADAALEERRLELAINANVLTDYVKANGMGGIDSARFSAAIKQLSETYDYKGDPDAALYFTDAYLPAGGFPVK